MLLVGPAELMAEAWRKLSEGISLEVPKGNDEENASEKKLTFLGCEHRLAESVVTLPNGDKKTVKGVE